MKASYIIFVLSLKLLIVFIDPLVNGDSPRRSLHQPLDPGTFTSPPSPSPPSFVNPDQPTPSPSNVTLPTLPSSTQQPFKPIKSLAIVCSVSIVTLGMLSALAFFLYRQRIKYRCKSRLLVEKEHSLSFRHDSGIPRSSFLNIGTVERRPCSVVEQECANREEDESSPLRRRLDSVKKLEFRSHLSSPELQPLPPLSKNQIQNPLFETPFSDEESRETVFHSPEWSGAVSFSDASNSTVFLGRKKEVRYNSPVVQVQRTSSPLSYLEASLIKQDQRRPSASSPPPPPPLPPTTPL